jgi:hypothetical protein
METTVVPPDEDDEDVGEPGEPDAAGGVDEVSEIDGLTRAGRRRLARAWLIGGVPTFLVYAWVLMAERWSPLQVQFFDNFYDAQARSLFHGRLDVPREVVGFEGFLIDGKTYIYFGPFPALLRMPIMALTDRFDGRLTTLSMLAAMAVLVWATFRLTCVVRGMVRGAVPVGPREALATSVLAVAVLASPPFFLASAAVVYHEAALWGLALTVASYDAAVRWQRDPTVRRLAVASALITCAILSRQTLALGALATLGLAGLGLLVRQWRARPEDRPAERRRNLVRRTLPALALAGLVPLLASSALNYAKLGQLFGLPMDRQLQSIMTDDRQDVIDANATFVGLEYVSTTSRQYLASPGLDVRRDFPWLDFPRQGPKLVDEEATFDELDWSSSMPASAPALAVLAAAGAVWSIATFRRRDHRDRLLPLWAGAAVGGVSVLAFGYIANRYLNDVYPVALVGGLVGFHAAGAASARWSPWLRRALMGGAGALVAFGALVNGALALEYQHERGPAVRESWRADWVRWRASLPGAREPLVIGRDDDMPAVADGELLVVGDCDGLYVGVDDKWRAVERGPGVGVHDIAVDVDWLPVGERVPLSTVGRGDQSTVVGIVRTGDHEVRVDVSGPEETNGPGEDAEWQLGEPLDVGGDTTFRVSTDRRQPTANVAHGDLVLNVTQLPQGDDLAVSVGEAPRRPGVARTAPRVEPVPPDMPACDQVLKLRS